VNGRLLWLSRLWLPGAVLLHSLLYVWLVGPWFHYDEPGHMLYVLQLLHGGAAAPPSETLIRETADAVIRSGFWQRFAAPPSLFEPLINSRVPTLQSHHPPLYYALVAALLLPLQELPIEQLLLIGRLFSAVMLTALVLIVRQIVREALPDHPPLAWIIPLSLVLNPAFSDLNTALNSDVLLNLASAVTLLGLLRLVRDGLRPSALLPACGGMLLVLLTKRTGIALVLPLAVGCFWALMRRPIHWRWYVAVLAGGLLIGSYALFAYDGTRWIVRPWFTELLSSFVRSNPTQMLNSLLDVERTAPYYREVLENIWDEYYVRLAWGDDRIAGEWLDWLVQMTMLVGALAAVPLLWSRRVLTEYWQQRWHGLMLIAVAAALLLVVLRVHPIAPGEKPWLPAGRYLYWAATAIAWLPAVGWYRLAQQSRVTWLRYVPLVVLAVADFAALRVLWF
jgi:hypothetical protein